jgi:hypothetical protein
MRTGKARKLQFQRYQAVALPFQAEFDFIQWCQNQVPFEVETIPTPLDTSEASYSIFQSSPTKKAPKAMASLGMMMAAIGCYGPGLHLGN